MWHNAMLKGSWNYSHFQSRKLLSLWISVHGICFWPAINAHSLVYSSWGAESILPADCQYVHLNPSSKWLDNTWKESINLVNSHGFTTVCRDKTLQRIVWRHSYNSCCMQNHTDQAAWTCFSKIHLESMYCCYLCATYVVDKWWKWYCYTAFTSTYVRSEFTKKVHSVNKQRNKRICSWCRDFQKRHRYFMAV